MDGIHHRVWVRRGSGTEEPVSFLRFMGFLLQAPPSGLPLAPPTYPILKCVAAAPCWMNPVSPPNTSPPHTHTHWNAAIFHMQTGAVGGMQ